jgi:hypothetical protein
VQCRISNRRSFSDWPLESRHYLQSNSLGSACGLSFALCKTNPKVFERFTETRPIAPSYISKRNDAEAKQSITRNAAQKFPLG